MPLRLVGVVIAVIVVLIALGSVSSVVVDWAWFSSIGYAGVFWTVLATKAAVFVVVFAVSTLLLWANGTLALRFASRSRPRVPAGLAPGPQPVVVTVGTTPSKAATFTITSGN